MQTSEANIKHRYKASVRSTAEQTHMEVAAPRKAVALWGVMTTISRPSPAVLSFLRCGMGEKAVTPHLVVVGDHATVGMPWEELAMQHARLEYLSPLNQSSLPYRILSLLKWDHFGRKNVGYLFAISKGADWVFDFDDASVLHASSQPGHTLFVDILADEIRSAPQSHNVHRVTTTAHLYNPIPDFRPTRNDGQPMFAWPRGFPLSFVSVNATFGQLPAGPAEHPPDELGKAAVFQSLSDHGVDVDALYRMTRELPLTFERRAEAALLPIGVFSPLNAQATLFRTDALWTLLLPTTVPARVADIWRGYIAQRLLWEVDALVVVTSPMVTHYRPAKTHTSVADAASELGSFARADQMLQALSSWTRQLPASMGEEQDVQARAFVDLFKALAVEGVLGEGDVALAMAWAADLKQLGYTIPMMPEASRQPPRKLPDPPPDERLERKEILRGAKASHADESGAGRTSSAKPGVARERELPDASHHADPLDEETAAAAADPMLHTADGSAVVPPSLPSPPTPAPFMQKYLQGNTEISVDVIVSFRSSENKQSLVVRDWYNRWLAYWPFQLGKMIFYTEDYPLVERLHACLTAQPYCPAMDERVVFRKIDVRAMTGKDYMERMEHASALGGRIFNMQMNAWKFDADRVSDAQVIAFTDDDSCMQDYVLPTEIVNAEGKLIANGVRIKPFPGFIMTHVESNRRIGLGWHAYFMIDFPVYVWRDMLPDFRAHVTKHAFPDTRFTKGELPEFWRAVHFLFSKHSGGWNPSEYTNLLQFAYESPKWRERYDWHIVGEYPHPIQSHASHYRGLGCLRPKPLTTLRERSSSSRAVDVENAIFYPTARSPVSGDNQMRSYRVQKWSEYTSLRESDEWREYLRARQIRLAEFAAERGNNVSASNMCGPAVVDKWDGCFSQMRAKEVEEDRCNWCEKASIHDIPGV